MTELSRSEMSHITAEHELLANQRCDKITCIQAPDCDYPIHACNSVVVPGENCHQQRYNELGLGECTYQRYTQCERWWIECWIRSYGPFYYHPIKKLWDCWEGCRNYQWGHCEERTCKTIAP